MTIVSLIVSFALFSAKRLLTYLHIFQQDEYDSARFLRWIVKKRTFDKRLSLLIIVVAIFHLAIHRHTWFYPLSIILLFLVFALKERDTRQHAKKKLVLTPRALRIFLLALLLSIMVGGIGMLAFSPFIWLVPIQLLPFLLVIAKESLQPIEKRIQQKYWNEAYAKVQKLQPIIIGITGSFGKTSLKHIFGHILETTCPTLLTPGSVNTQMGITRIIRERLTPHHKYFVVEMGAYGKGSIARLCDLTPPDMAIVTGIGYSHYERFKSLQTVAMAKFELVEAVCKKGGKIVTHADVLSFPYTSAFANTHAEKFIICDGEKAALSIKQINQQREGLIVDVVWYGEMYTLEAPLYGKHHGKNMALAFAAACTLDIAPKTVITALKSTPQIAHRLEVRSQLHGSVLIDDAFNSNPEGFVAALELLDALRQPGGRRILVTPGMVELGKVHDFEHEKIGLKAAECADIVLAVVPERIKTFTESFKKNATSHQKLILCSTFANAQTWLAQNTRSSDVILLENDLPDLYELSLKL